MDKQIKVFTPEIKRIEEGGQTYYDVMISTESVDRDGDIVEAAGAIVTNYLKNPVVLWGHDYRSPESIVGTTTDLEKIPGHGIRSRLQFVPEGVNPRADLVRGLWDGGFLNAASIGFDPKQYEPLGGDGPAGESYATGYRFSQWELLEWSIVSIPANQDALRLAAKELGIKLDPGKAINDNFEQLDREDLAIISGELQKLIKKIRS